MRRIPESEYMAYVDGVLNDLAQCIIRSGLSISEIARETRMTRNTVYNASQGIPVSFVNACRIRYFINQYHNENSK